MQLAGLRPTITIKTNELTYCETMKSLFKYRFNQHLAKVRTMDLSFFGLL